MRSRICVLFSIKTQSDTAFCAAMNTACMKQQGKGEPNRCADEISRNFADCRARFYLSCR
ncbi:hypothetical protein [uncultured Campylobacter sp.]|uniref:hypothetical protein n=1 Tax=uncultured Campylobacter sp. TaxID=218934 RepID=UPI0026279E18|nr:hypothetical protein [uncultured Campylobacter sp.]